MTIIYFIRHSIAEEIKLKRNTSLLECNKNTRLTKEGRIIAKDFSKNKYLQNIDVLISSDYKRAIETALFFSNNKKSYEINSLFGERIHGVEDFSELPEDFEKKQLEDENYKIGYGESQKEVRSRMYHALQEVLEFNKGKQVAIISHSTAITFLLMKWCTINKNGEYVYKDKVFFSGEWNPCTSFKLVFDDNNRLTSIDEVKSELKIMSFNLRHIIKEEFFGAWKTRYARIVDFIKCNNPDIVGVQELTRKGKRYLKRNLRDYNIIGKKRHSIIFTNEYNCLLVKKDIKITWHKTFSLSDKINRLGRKSKEDNFPRICTVAHLQKENIKYFFANTHIDNSNSENKKRMLDIFDSIVNKYKKKEEYVIITGDFNMSLNNKYLEKYAEKYLDPLKNYQKTTYASDPDMRAIDHIFLDKKFTYRNEKVHSNSNDFGFMSDHYPISCEIEI